MKTKEEILLDYVVKKSYTDLEARSILDLYDSKRTGLKLSTVSLINSLIRSGNVKLANHFMQKILKQGDL